MIIHGEIQQCIWYMFVSFMALMLLAHMDVAINASLRLASGANFARGVEPCGAPTGGKLTE